MDATAANKARWHYAQFRPCGVSVGYIEATSGIVWADCSAGTAILARLAGAPNPLHAGSFDGYGNTGSCWGHLTHIFRDEAQVGDCVVYGQGPDGTHHMSMVREAGPDPLLWSNGWEGAPELIRFSTQNQHQGGWATFCRLMPPDPVEPPLPKVDPFWAWLRWYLGEGEFRAHKRDPASRPKDAPTVIPLAWWRRERKFLAAREGMQ
jgi:hypothetical protein